MSFVPPDFGGLLGVWDPRRPVAMIVRYGEGKPREGLHLTPLNLLQLQKTVNHLIKEGRETGFITLEHESQAERLPAKSMSADQMAADVMPRDEVDRIAGDG